jgi:hypothetical protein
MREFFLDPKTRRTDCLNGYGIQWRSFTESYLDSTGTFRDGSVREVTRLRVGRSAGHGAAVLGKADVRKTEQPSIPASYRLG